jgi:hypothetical protein
MWRLLSKGYAIAAPNRRAAMRNIELKYLRCRRHYEGVSATDHDANRNRRRVVAIDVPGGAKKGRSREIGL